MFFSGACPLNREKGGADLALATAEQESGITPSSYSRGISPEYRKMPPPPSVFWLRLLDVGFRQVAKGEPPKDQVTRALLSACGCVPHSCYAIDGQDKTRQSTRSGISATDQDLTVAMLANSIPHCMSCVVSRRVEASWMMSSGECDRPKDVPLCRRCRETWGLWNDEIRLPHSDPNPRGVLTPDFLQQPLRHNNSPTEFIDGNLGA